MARTVTAIYNEIITEKESMATLSGLQPDPDDAQTFLDDITSSSKVAVWRHFAWLVASAIWTHEKLWDAFKLEVQAIADRAVPGTEKWYQQKLYDFQYPDTLTFVDNVPAFDPVDTSLQIIKRAAVVSGTCIITAKVAKLVAGVVTPLSSLELDAVTQYLEEIKFAGTGVTVISLNPDDLKLTMDVHYDALNDLSVVQTAVEAAINDYLANLEFNGDVVLQKVVDAIQAVDGVNDIEVTTFEGRSGTAAYAQFTRVYETAAGYAVIDSANPLSSTVTYIAS